MGGPALTYTMSLLLERVDAAVEEIATHIMSCQNSICVLATRTMSCQNTKCVLALRLKPAWARARWTVGEQNPSAEARDARAEFVALLEEYWAEEPKLDRTRWQGRAVRVIRDGLGPHGLGWT